MADIRTEEGRLAQARENVSRPDRADEVEQQARAVARHLGQDEDAWREQLPLLVAVEQGRLMAAHLHMQTPEWREGMRHYMSTR
jgi:hypothetical protein